MWYPANAHLEVNQIVYSLKQVSESAYAHAFIDAGMIGTPSVVEQCGLLLDDVLLLAEPVKPDVLIFHLSHCGSSLLAQMLKNKTNSAVWGEPELINTILLDYMFHVTSTVEPIVTRLQKAGVLLCQSHVNVIKLSSWNIFHAHLFKKAFPDAAYIYIHRNPMDVLASLLHEPNGFAMWNKHASPLLASQALELSMPNVHALHDHEYMARMIHLHLTHAIQLIKQGATVLIYPQWVNEFPKQINNLLSLTEAELFTCKQETKQDAKQPDKPFQRRRAEQVSWHISSEVLEQLQACHHHILDLALSKINLKK